MSAFENGDIVQIGNEYLLVRPISGVASTGMASISSTCPSDPRTPDNAYNVYTGTSAMLWAERAPRCAYCDSDFHPSKFHPGSCQECGAPIGRKA